MGIQLVPYALWSYQLPFFLLTKIFKPGVQADIFLEMDNSLTNI